MTAQDEARGTPSFIPAESKGLLRIQRPFGLECGQTLKGLEIAYETWGCLNATRDNAVLVFHALTGGAHAASHGEGDELGWWESLIGQGKPLDPGRHFIVCANVLGSCYGTTGPSGLNRETGRPYGSEFPIVTTRDMVRAQRFLMDALGVERLALVIGGSLGAMLTWRWIVEYPGSADAAVAIAGTVQASPWAIALNTVARQAIALDPEWEGGDYAGKGPRAGFALARMIAMISYRCEAQFRERFGRTREDQAPASHLAPDNLFQVERFLMRQGDKVVRRFDARSYVSLTKAMDLHDVAQGHGSLDEALGQVQARVLCVGIDSDVLFDPEDLKETARTLNRQGVEAAYSEIHSTCGHDAFLVEHPQLNTMVSTFLEGRTLCAF